MGSCDSFWFDREVSQDMRRARQKKPSSSFLGSSFSQAGLNRTPIGIRTSDFGLRTSEFGLRNSDFEHVASDPYLATPL